MTDYISREAATAYAPLPKELREYQTGNLDDAWDDGYDFAISQINAIPAADVRPKWISVEDELPSPEQDVLVSVKIRLKGAKKFESVVAMDYINSTGEWNNASHSWRWEVTHWMPLPEPPEKTK